MRRVRGALMLASLMAACGAARAQSPKQAQQLKQATAAFREGVAARTRGDLKQAQKKFAEVVRLAPQIAEGHEALGTVLLEQGQAQQAIAELTAAEKLKPNDMGTESRLAQAYTQAGATTAALPHYAAALKLAAEPGQAALDASFYEGYGRALAASDRPDEAISQFMAEEALTGRSAALDDAIGSLYAQSKQWDNARGRFEHALTLDANYLPARIHLGVLEREQHELPEALATLKAAAEATPVNATALMEYGRTLAAAGEDDAAIEVYQQALKASPADATAALELGMALQREGRQADAIPWFEQALKGDPKSVTALTNLGLAQTMTGKAKDALETLAQAQALDPQDATIWKDLGVTHVQLSAFDEAIGDFQHAAALEPNDPETHYDLGLAYKFKDRYEEAIAELTKAGEMDPALQDPPYTLGILLMQMGRLDGAVTELRKAVALRPENGDAWAILGSTLKQASRLPEAAEALEKAIPLLPGQPGPRVTLAGVYAEEAANLKTDADAAESAGDAAKATQLRAQMQELRGKATALRRESAELARGAVNRQRANFEMNAGNQEILRGQIAAAVSRYQQAIAADPTFSAPHEQLAIAYERQGRADDAATEREKAAELEKAK